MEKGSITAPSSAEAQKESAAQACSREAWLKKEVEPSPEWERHLYEHKKYPVVMDPVPKEFLQQSQHDQSDEQSKLPPRIEALQKQELSAQQGLGDPLTPYQNAELFSWRQFPDASDAHYRDIARKEILAQYGLGRGPTQEEEADMVGKRAFPNDQHLHDLATMQHLANSGIGRELTSVEVRDLLAGYQQRAARQ